MRLKDFYEGSLSFRQATESDVPSLTSIGNSWEEMAFTEGSAFSKDELAKSIKNGNLPPIPDASLQNYGLYLILSENACKTQSKLDSKGSPIGLLELYKGYPTPNTLWIGLFIIDSKYRRNGYGTQCLQSIINFAKSNDLTHIGIGVSLKNWRGLRFWHSIGFDKIERITGDVLYSEKTHALLSLSRPI